MIPTPNALSPFDGHAVLKLERVVPTDVRPLVVPRPHNDLSCTTETDCAALGIAFRPEERPTRSGGTPPAPTQSLIDYAEKCFGAGNYDLIYEALGDRPKAWYAKTRPKVAPHTMSLDDVEEPSPAAVAYQRTKAEWQALLGKKSDEIAMQNVRSARAQLLAQPPSPENDRAQDKYDALRQALQSVPAPDPRVVEAINAMQCMRDAQRLVGHEQWVAEFNAATAYPASKPVMLPPGPHAQCRDDGLPVPALLAEFINRYGAHKFDIMRDENNIVYANPKPGVF